MQRPSFPASYTQTRIGRTGRIGRITFAIGIAGAAILGTFAAANAQTTTTTPTAAKTQLTQAQLDAAKACMTAKGFTVRPHDDNTAATTIAGTPTTVKVPRTAEQRAAFEAAAVACGLPAGGHGGPGGAGGPDGPGGPDGRGGPGGHGGGLALTDAQKACLTGKGITSRRSPPTARTPPARGQPESPRLMPSGRPAKRPRRRAASSARPAAQAKR